MNDLTANTLNKLMVGDRFWFWFCSDVEKGFPLFMAKGTELDPDMNQLQNDAKGIPLKLGGIPMMGLGNVANDGHIQLSCTMGSKSTLAALSVWVKENVSLHPEFARLKNAELFNISAQGLVRSIHKDDNLWSGVPDIIARGSLAESAQRLTKLKPEQNYWFWLAEKGPGDDPFLLLGPSKRDTEAESFVNQIVALRGRATGLGTEIKGVVQMSTGGTLLFSTEDDITECSSIMTALVNSEPTLTASLNNALVLHKKGAKIDQTFILSLPSAPVSKSKPKSKAKDLSNQVEVLGALKSEDDKALFWMCTVSGTTHLILSTDKDALKSSVKALGAAEKSIRGQVVVSSSGWLGFRIRSPYPGFLDELIEWTRSNHSDWPDLLRLKGARVMQIDGDKNIVDRQKNSAGWDSIN